MRDDRLRWPPVTDFQDAAIVAPHVTVTSHILDRQVIISGQIEACLAASGCAEAFGGDRVVSGQTYALRLRRDRILVVNGGAHSDGWHKDHGIAISDLTSGICVFELLGPAARAVINSGTEYMTDAGSASVSHIWHGNACQIYRYEDDSRFRIHVGHAYGQSVWEMFERQFAAVAVLSGNRKTNDEVVGSIDR